MKVLVSGDWHLDCFKIGKTDPETDLDLRVKDFLNAVDYMIDYAILNKIDLFIMNGDLFKGRTSTHHIETVVAERFRKIASHMRLIINLGNHDYTPKQLTYGTYTYSILEKFNINNCDVYTEITHLQLDSMDLVLYPYYDLKRTSFNKNVDLIDWVHEIVHGFDLTQPSKLFVGHGTPKGTIINDDWFFDLDVIDEPILPHSVFESFDMVLFSHIHRRHEISPRILHIGSPERVDFAEAKDDKGFVVYDTDTNKVEWISTNPRPMTDLKLNLLDIDEFTDPNEEIQSAIMALSDLDQRMIKVSIELSSQTYSQIDHIQLKECLDRSFWYKVPSFNIPKKQKTRIKELTEQLTASEALSKVLEVKEELSEQDRTQIMIRGRGILSSNE